MGLAAAPVCAGICVPALLPALLSRDDTRVRSHALSVGAFLAGRLLGYAAVGLLFGWLGTRVSGSSFYVASRLARALLGAALLLYAVSETTRAGGFCRAVHRWGTAARFPLLIGLLSGVNLCPPFVAAVEQVASHGGALHGLAYFLVFFLATSLVTVPVFFVALGNIVQALRSIGRVACALVGIAFLCTAAREIAPHLGLGARVAMAETPPAVAAPGTGSVTRRSEEKFQPVHHLVITEAGRNVGIAAFTQDLAPEVEGYDGHVPLRVVLDMEGCIQDVELLENNETLDFFQKVRESNLLKQLIGKTPADAIEVGKDIDAVTGATITSIAVVDGVRLTARRLAGVLTDRKEEVAAGVSSSSWLNPWYLALLPLIGVAVVGELRRMKWLRYVVLAVAFLYLGVWKQAFFSVHHIAKISLSALPPFGQNAPWYILAAAALGLALLMGRVYCAWLCPFGALSELLGRLFKSPIKISIKWDRRLRRVKYFVLLAVLISFALFNHAGILYVEPFVDTFTLGFLSEGASAAGTVLRAGWLILILVGCMLVFRFFCRYLCPAGAAMAFLARHRVFGRIRPDRCVECGECSVSCPKRGGMP